MCIDDVFPKRILSTRINIVLVNKSIINARIKFINFFNQRILFFLEDLVYIFSYTIDAKFLCRLLFRFMLNSDDILSKTVLIDDFLYFNLLTCFL